MLSLKLAYRNLIGAGLRTWLNVIVLSFSFVIIIWNKGLLNGWNEQAKRDMIDWQIGGGQYWQKDYDPYDMFTINESHSVIPDRISDDIQNGLLTPILINTATIYPEGRMQNVLLKGILPEQKILKLPTDKLQKNSDEISILIGSRMAESNKLQVGDYFTIRWRDANGTFDAADAKVVDIFHANVPIVDQGKIWLSLEQLQKMLQTPNEATMLITENNSVEKEEISGWVFRGHDYLLKEMDNLIKMKSVGGSIFYGILLALALLAIFDTQILSIFRRQKEIGTEIALGMTRWQVVRLFTVEGAMYSVFAAILAAIYGIPLLTWQAKVGLAMPEGADDYGLPIAKSIFPSYSIGLVIGTVLTIFIATVIVSYLPAKKISKMNPTDAIKGKIQ
ncbi:MAG: FtsX-like permease family protein [Candidatus Marinimicrobia bacterium]|jgi:putative ABC transport system permease protein|nr:FtsX-like permease family protein [Candidatus Neomarinimicrobiota bacterium]